MESIRRRSDLRSTGFFALDAETTVLQHPSLAETRSKNRERKTWLEARLTQNMKVVYFNS